MAETIKTVTQFIETGEVRVGVEIVTDLSYLVSRQIEDHVMWSFGSKIKRNALRYRHGYDDFMPAWNMWNNIQGHDSKRDQMMFTIDASLHLYQMFTKEMSHGMHVP